MMKALRLDEVGPPENLKLVDLPVPKLGPDDILIKVAYAGLIFADCELRRGTYYLPTKLPYFPGREVAGTIAAVGSDVRDWAPGARVVALVLSGGGCAEYVKASTKDYTFPSGITVPATDMLALPDNISFRQSLAYVINFRLAHILFHSYIGIPPGACVLVHGAAGGFGSQLTLIAHAHGNPVIALSRSAQEAAYCRSNGADHCLDITRVDYVDEARKLTGGQGVDYSLNGVSGETLDRDAHAVRTFGEIVVYGYAGGRAKFDPWTATKCVTLKTFSADDFLGGPALVRANEAMYDWFRSRPIADATRTFDLADAAAAHHWIEDGKVMGKIALRVA